MICTKYIPLEAMHCGKYTIFSLVDSWLDDKWYVEKIKPLVLLYMSDSVVKCQLLDFFLKIS